MSVLYHSFDSSNLPVDELVAGAYAEHVGSLGYDESLSTLSRNAVENKVITQRILADEDAYLTKVDAAATYATGTQLSNLKTYVQDLYPLGTIYMNDTATTVPFDFGTWDLVDGKFLYGCSSDFSDIGDTGGATSVTLLTSHLPSGNIPVAFPAISGTTGDASTQHYHSGTTDSTNTAHTHHFSATTGSMSSNSSGSVSDMFNGFTSGTGGTGCISLTPNTLRGGISSGSANSWGTLSINVSHTHSVSGDTGGMSANSTHSHSFSTGNMSANSTHSHSFSIPSQSLNINLNSGAQVAFNILPPYKKVGVWRRSA